MNFKVGSPQDIRRFQNQEAGKKLVFDAAWEVRQAPPNSLVGIRAVSRVQVAGTSAEIQVYQLLDGKKIPVEVFNAPYKDGVVETHWRTVAVEGKNIQAGVYHFKVSVGSYSGETVEGLILRDSVVDIYKSSFIGVKPQKPKVVF